MATNKTVSTKSVGRNTAVRKEQAAKRKKMYSDAKTKADGLRDSEMSSMRFKDPKTGKTSGWQSDKIYRNMTAKEKRAAGDTYTKSQANRATGALKAAKAKKGK